MISDDNVEIGAWGGWGDSFVPAGTRFLLRVHGPSTHS